MVNLIDLEEFKRRVPHQIMSQLVDTEETDLLKAARLAEAFALVRRYTHGDKKNVAHNVQSSKRFKSGTRDHSREQNQTPTNRNLLCHFCKKKGYDIREYPDPKWKGPKQNRFTKPVATTNVRGNTTDLFKAFKSRGTVSSSLDNKKFPINIVRDTCCAQTEKVLPNIEECFTGEKVYLDVLKLRTDPSQLS